MTFQHDGTWKYWSVFHITFPNKITDQHNIWCSVRHFHTLINRKKVLMFHTLFPHDRQTKETVMSDTTFPHSRPPNECAVFIQYLTRWPTKRRCGVPCNNYTIAHKICDVHIIAYQKIVCGYLQIRTAIKAGRRNCSDALCNICISYLKNAWCSMQHFHKCLQADLLLK